MAVVCGIMTVEVLAEMEEQLRLKLGREDDFVLADYFDFVAGTSTGAILAACISIGMKMSDIRSFTNSGKEMFDKAFLLKRFRYQYKDESWRRRCRRCSAGIQRSAATS